MPRVTIDASGKYELRGDREMAQANFDPSNDGVDRCSAFMTAFIALLREHRVMINAKFQNLELVKFHHEGEGPDTGWEIDMQDIHFLNSP